MLRGVGGGATLGANTFTGNQIITGASIPSAGVYPGNGSTGLTQAAGNGLNFLSGVNTTTLNVDSSGNLIVSSTVATPAAGAATARLVFGTTAGFGIYYGSGAPTVSAAQGSLYLRSDGSTTTSRAYINNSAGSGTTWTAITTAA